MSKSYHCLYTKHKTQKRKIWNDGKLAVEPSGFINLFSLNDVISSCNTSLDTLSIPPSQVQAIINGAVANLQMEKHLVTIETEWKETKGNSASSGSREVARPFKTMSKSTVGMEKLLTKKFTKPGRYIPKIDTNNQGPATKRRKAPLQPGQYLRNFQQVQGQSQNLRPNHLQQLHRSHQHERNFSSQSEPQITHTNLPVSATQWNQQRSISSHQNYTSYEHRNSEQNHTSAILLHTTPRASFMADRRANKITLHQKNTFAANEYDPTSYYEEEEEEEEESNDRGTYFDDVEEENRSDGCLGKDEQATLTNSALLDLFETSQDENACGDFVRDEKQQFISVDASTGQSSNYEQNDTKHLEENDGKLQTSERKHDNPFLEGLLQSEAEMEFKILGTTNENYECVSHLGADDCNGWDNENKDDCPWDTHGNCEENNSTDSGNETQLTLTHNADVGVDGCETGNDAESTDVDFPMRFDINVDVDDSSSSTGSS